MDSSVRTKLEFDAGQRLAVVAIVVEGANPCSVGVKCTAVKRNLLQSAESRTPFMATRMLGFSSGHVARNEVAQHQLLDASAPSNLPNLLGRGVALDDVAAKGWRAIGTLYQGVDAGDEERLVHQHVGTVGEVAKLGIEGSITE